MKTVDATDADTHREEKILALLKADIHNRVALLRSQFYGHRAVLLWSVMLPSASLKPATSSPGRG